jgi:hypothetical protein
MCLHFMALWQRADKDCSENVRQVDVLTENCRSVSVNAQSRLVAAIGLDEVVVGETKDGIWVVHKTHAQDVKKLSPAEKIRPTKTHESQGCLSPLENV